MGQSNLAATKLFEMDSKVTPKRRGPPNRMNDLPYREWMKFQKSFFRYSSDQILIKECIEFFTKATWTDGRSSRSLVLNFDEFDDKGIFKPRIIHSRSGFTSINGLVNHLASLIDRNEKYDFIIIDIRKCLKDKKALSNFLLKSSAKLFTSLRKLLFNERYCGIIVNTGRNSATSFPIPWLVAQSSRAYLKLRDEKIALVESMGRVFYCLFMQARDDERKGLALTPQTFRLTKTAMTIPGWIIPKPPPRKKNEILHPAKFPETLIEEFIELFTKPNDSVFDPMVGTGSAVVAAIRKDRSGFGLELSGQYAEIASNRIVEETSHHANLFKKHQVEAKIIEGNALKLAEVPELAKRRFNYVVTSPPYWSMLRNPGSEYQEGRRKRNLPLVYSGNKSDLGNVEDYDEFLDLLEKVYNDVANKLCDGGILTVILKNVKRNHILYTLAWDLAIRLCRRNGKYEYVGTTFWCQDDVGLKPFAVGIHWVSNILHQYCLHFRKWDDM